MPTAPSNNKKLNKKFIKAAQNNRLDELKSLLSQGADIHADDDGALKWSAGSGQLEIVKILIEHGAKIHTDNDSPLRWSANNGHIDTVKLLLTHGANVHADDDYALRWSVYNEHYDVWKVLSAFIQEEKLLVAAVVSVPLVAKVGVTSAGGCLCGMLVLPEVGFMAQKQPVKLKKSQRQKI